MIWKRNAQLTDRPCFEEGDERLGYAQFRSDLVWGKLADYAGTLTKGAHVQIEGEIQWREYAQKGTSKHAAEAKKSITEVRVNSILKLDRATGTANIVTVSSHA